MSDKKLLTIIISIAILIVLVSFILYLISYKPSINLNNNNQKEKNQPQLENKIINKSNTDTLPVKLPYGEAVNFYAGKRIQFDQNCVASPYAQVFKKGDVIMLDNRSNTTKKISLDGKSYTITGYDYSLATLTTLVQLPHTILIDCDDRQNVASINLQK